VLLTEQNLKHNGKLLWRSFFGNITASHLKPHFKSGELQNGVISHRKYIYVKMHLIRKETTWFKFSFTLQNGRKLGQALLNSNVPRLTNETRMKSKCLNNSTLQVTMYLP
jgi:hypothetical protein